MTHDISHLRASIDAIDDEIIALLNKRSEFVKQVGMTKKRRQQEGVCFIRSGREAEVVRGVYERLLNGGIFPALPALQMWRMIICASLSLESDLSIATCPSPDNELYWLAREYFGNFTPVAAKNSVQEVIKEIIDGKTEVGVFPSDHSNLQERWWLNLPEVIKIFACLPFVMERQKKIPAFAAARLEPEDTGNDRTLLKVISTIDSTKDTISNMLESHFRTGVDMLDNTTTKGQSAFLVSIPGFFSSPLSLKPLEITILGTYAAPVLL